MSTTAKYKIESNTYNEGSIAEVVQETRRGRDGFWAGEGQRNTTGIWLGGLYSYRAGEALFIQPWKSYSKA